MRLRPQPAWMMRLKPGDVIVAASGLERVVRHVSFWRKIVRGKGRVGELRMHMVTVTIAHCSWTHAPVTHLDQAQLKQYGYRPVGVRSRMRTKLDKRIKAYIDAGPPHAHRRDLTCCDVRGVR